MSQVNISQIGVADRPSPSVWKNCPKTLLNDLGLGNFFHSEFLAVAPNTTAEDLVYDGLVLVGDTPVVVAANVTPVDIFHGRMDIETDGDDNDAWALFVQTMASFNINSAQRVWLEARVNLGAAADQGMFFGFAEEDGLDVDIVVDGGATVGGESMVGFSVLSGDTGAVNAVYGLDAGTTVTVLADASRSAVITAGGGTVADFPVADTYMKFGMYFDGRTTLRYFVDGHNVASVELDSSIFPNNVDMGPIWCLKTGTGAAVSGNIDWFRAAFQERY